MRAEKHGRREYWPLFALVLVSTVLAASQGRDEDRVYKIKEEEQVKKTLTLAEESKTRTLILDNVFGGIEVKAADVGSVALTAKKTIRARSPETLKKAKDEVALRVEQDGNTVNVYVDGPFRCQCPNGRGIDGRDRGYEVRHDFVLTVPRRVDLTLKTVTDGDITVHGVEGVFDITNVNGEVRLESMIGSGAAHTVNGEVRATFARNPEQVCSFKTVNGDITLTFRDGLAADFRLKTSFGDAYTDFATVPLPAQSVKKESREGRYHYVREAFTGLRVGKGGPEIRCDTLNGDILIRKGG